MSNQDTPSHESDDTSRVSDTVDIASLENVEALARDMMDRNMTLAQTDLDALARDRLGPNATAEDAKRVLNDLKTTLLA